MPFITINHVQYFVKMVGKGEPLVLLHGFTGSGRSWARQTAVFSPHFRTITIDLLGHGRTHSPTNPDRYQMERAAADIIAILKREAGAGKRQKFHLLGYSMGGRLALFLAVHFPDWFHSLVLESASPGLATAVARRKRRRQDNDLADWIETNGIEAFVARWEQLPLWASQAQLSPETRLALRQKRRQNKPTGLANSLRGMGTGVQPSLWPYLGDLTMPALLLAGELDAKFVDINRHMHARLPQALLEIVSQAGHTIHLERPSQFNNITLSFWRQL